MARTSAYSDPRVYQADPANESKRDLEDYKHGSTQQANASEIDIVSETEHRQLKRGLEQRHLSMIALAGQPSYLLKVRSDADSLCWTGAIGTGLFLSLGGAIATAGPVGALLAYFIIGLLVCAVQYALGEVAALLPVSGSFVRHAEVLADPSLGFALGWNVVYGNWLSVSRLSCQTVFYVRLRFGDRSLPRFRPSAFCSHTGPTLQQLRGS